MTSWTLESIRALFHTPLLELVYQAATVHRRHFDPLQVQRCSLLSIKTGGCPENCSYCPQSSHYQTGVKAEKLMAVDDVLKAAKNAKDSGATRFCMGAAWRKVRDSGDFEQVLEMVKGVNTMGMECCVTLGMLTEPQAQRLKEAGLYAYNHNLDTSRNHYSNIITTRTFDDRLETLDHVRKAGISVCCGGILGLGETEEDRISMLHTLSSLATPPESVPINALVPIEGTPLENQKKISPFEMTRMIATTRIVLPTSMVRLSAGRLSLSPAEQALCFFAGANSIFVGDKLLTSPNPEVDADLELFNQLGLKGMPGHVEEPETACESLCC
jgi:biotin synthase